MKGCSLTSLLALLRVAAAQELTAWCGQISVLGIFPWCSGKGNPYITEWGSIDVSKAEPWMEFINEFCDDESIEDKDKVVTVQGCSNAEDPPTVGVHLYRKGRPEINATFVVHGDPKELCSTHLCSNYQVAWGETTLDDNFDYDCTASGGPKSETRSDHMDGDVVRFNYRFGFFEDELTPNVAITKADMEGVICQTQYFLSQLLQNATNTKSFHAKATEIDWGYYEGQDLPAHVNFTIEITDAAIEGDVNWVDYHILINEMESIGNAGLQKFITDWVWKAPPVGLNFFINANRITLHGVKQSPVQGQMAEAECPDTEAPTMTPTTMEVTLEPMPEEDPCSGDHSNILCQDDGTTVDDMDKVTTAPTPTLFINKRTNTLCSQLKPGDVFVYLVASDDPDDIGFLALENIPGGLELLLTDNAWTGTEFASDEGTVKLVVDASGIPSGHTFGYGFDYGKDQQWVEEQGIFNFGTSGDSLFLYCIGINGVINPLVGFSNNGKWSEPGLEGYSYLSAGSALPDKLAAVGSVALPHFDNYVYIGPQAEGKTDLQQSMMDINNWKGLDEGLGDQGGGWNGEDEGDGTMPTLTSALSNSPSVSTAPTIREQEIKVKYYVSIEDKNANPTGAIWNGISVSWPVFLQEVVTNITAARNKGQAHDVGHHKLVVGLEPDSAFHTIEHVSCPSQSKQGMKCHNVTSSYILFLQGDEDQTTVEQEYERNTIEAVANGNYQAVLDRVDPSSPIIIGVIAGKSEAFGSWGHLAGAAAVNMLVSVLMM